MGLESAFINGSLTAVDQAVTLENIGYGAVVAQLRGTWVGTVTFEASVDGNRWDSVSATKSDTSASATTATAVGAYVISAAGFQFVRARCSAYTSGTIVAALRADPASAGGSSSGGGGGGAVTIADGADVAEGATADAKVTGDSAGTVSAKLRGLNYLLALVTDTVNNWIRVSLQASSAVIGHVVTDSGSTTAVTQATAANLNATVVGTGTFATQAVAAGDVANDGVDSGNPVKVGGKAASAAPTAVAAADRVNALFDLWGRLFVRSGAQAPAASTWTQAHIPATNTQATKSQAAAGSGKRNVCTGFTVTLCAGSAAPTAATPITVSVIDGATGGDTYLWRTNICLPATANAIVSFNRSGLWLVGSQNTALTIEFSAAAGANTYQSVSMDGAVVEE